MQCYHSFTLSNQYLTYRSFITVTSTTIRVQCSALCSSKVLWEISVFHVWPRAYLQVHGWRLNKDLRMSVCFLFCMRVNMYLFVYVYVSTSHYVSACVRLPPWPSFESCAIDDIYAAVTLVQKLSVGRRSNLFARPRADAVQHFFSPLNQTSAPACSLKGRQ